MFNLKNCLNNQDPLLMKKVMIRNILSLQSALDTMVHPKHFLYSSATLIVSDANPLCRMLCLSCPTALPALCLSHRSEGEHKSQSKWAFRPPIWAVVWKLQKEKNIYFLPPVGSSLLKALVRQSAIWKIIYPGILW